MTEPSKIKIEPVQFNEPLPEEIPGSKPYLYSFWRQVSSENRRWVRKNLHPEATWAIVREGRIIEEGFQEGFPSIWAVENRGTPKHSAYLMTRPSVKYRDRTLYFRDYIGPNVAELVGENEEAIEPYSESESISMLDVRSGKLRALGSFTVGNLRTIVRKGATHLVNRDTPGATCAFISERRLDGKPVVIDYVRRRYSVWQSRGYHVIPRLHVCDDPVADIFVTYNNAKLPGWPELVLSGKRKG